MKRSTTLGITTPASLLLALALLCGAALLAWVILPEPPPAQSHGTGTVLATEKRGPDAKGLPHEVDGPDKGEAFQQKAEQSLGWAERKLKKVPPLPLKDREIMDFWRLKLSEVEETFQRVIGKYGGTARAYVGLGECQLRLGEYEAAVHSFSQALQRSPSDAAAQTGYQRASLLLQVSREVGSQLPKEHQVLHLRRFPVGTGKTLWAVLWGKVYSDLEDFSEVHLSLFQKTHQGYRQVWQSEVLGCGYDFFSAVQLYVLDLTGDGRSEVGVWMVSPGGEYLPSFLHVFAWRGSHLTQILEVRSDFPLWIDDLNHDGRYEVGCYGTIGTDLYPVERLSWTDIYAYKQGKYVLANQDFPQEFRGKAKELREVLKYLPGHPEFLEYLGLVHEIEGHPKAARAAYQQAEKACRDRHLDWRRKDLQDRIRRLSRRGR